MEWLRRFRRLIAAHEAELCQLLEDELHRPRHQALLGEIAPLLSSLEWLEDAAPRLLRDRVVTGSPWWMRGTRVLERREALGHVGIIASWSNPLFVLGVQLAQAIAAGNSVIVKPCERCPKTHVRLLELGVSAGLPEGVLSWTGATREAGANMLVTRQFDHVLFTGSNDVGQRVAQTLAKTLTPITLEMSGRDSAFVLEDADPRKAAAALWGSIMYAYGQYSVAPRRVMVMERVYESFIKEMMKFASVGSEVKLVDGPTAQKCKELVSKALARGARDAGMLQAVAPKFGTNLPGDEVNDRFRPTVLIDCEPSMEVVEGRHFGPLLAVIKCHSLEEALAIHQRCDQHLAASVYTKNARTGRRLAQHLGVSNVLINDSVVPMMHPGLAFGGVGAAGIGVSRGEEGLLSLTHPVYITVSAHNVARYAQEPKAWHMRWATRIVRLWHQASKAQRSDKGKVLPDGSSILPVQQKGQGGTWAVGMPVYENSPLRAVHANQSPKSKADAA
jgi:aldehyde dehydrogenase (NAD+)